MRTSTLSCFGGISAWDNSLRVCPLRNIQILFNQSKVCAFACRKFRLFWKIHSIVHVIMSNECTVYSVLCAVNIQFSLASFVGGYLTNGHLHSNELGTLLPLSLFV